MLNWLNFLEMKRIYCLILSLAFLFLYPCLVQANGHTPTATILGQVTDKNHNTPLPHVQVFIETINRGDVTNLEGRFRIDRLFPGRYELIFKLQGYKTLLKKGIIVSANESVEINVEMSPTIIELESLLVTATRNKDSAFEVPQLVSIVSPRKIQKRNIQQTPELLREEVGVVVQKTNQGGGSPIIRGLKANKLLFLIDGIRLNNSTYRGGNIQYLSTVDSDALSRVEVVHGPVSVLYGSDALGGVINVITKNPTLNKKHSYTFNGSVSGSLSTADETQTTHVNFMTSNAKWGIILDGSFKSFGDIRRGSHGGSTLMHRLANDSRTERVLNKTQAPNGYDAYDLNTKALVKISDFQRLTLAYQLNRQKAVPRYDVIEVRKDSSRLFDPQERDLVYLSFFNNKGNRFFNSFSATFSLHRQFERRIRQKFGSKIETRDQFRTLTTGLQLQFNKLVAVKHNFVCGTEVYYDDVATKSFQRNTTTDERVASIPLFPDGSFFLNFGLFVQDAVQLLPRWNVTIGGRLSAFKLRAPFEDDPTSLINLGTLEQSSSALTGSLGSHFKINENLAFVTNLAQGFRTPNLDDVSKLGPGKGSSFFDVPNPDVEPEKSVSIDGGVKIHSPRLQANLIGFYNRITDLLVRNPTEFNGLPFIIEEGDTLAVFHKENASKAVTTGFALNAELFLNPNLRLFANLSYTYGQNISADEPLTGIPPFNGIFGIHWNESKYWAEFHARFAAEQTRLPSEDKLDLRIPEGGTPGWYILSLRTGMKISNSFAVKLTITNLLDLNYREHLSGFNASGRNFILGGQFKY